MLQQRHLLGYESEPDPWTLTLNPNPNPRTHPNPNPNFNRNRNKVFERKQNRTKMTPEYRSTYFQVNSLGKGVGVIRGL